MSKKEIIIAETAGFCFGVKRAVQLAFDTEVVNPTYTFGPIIHNDSVINRLANKGIVAIDTMGDKAINTLIIRAHGVGKHIYDEAKEKKIQLVDATCPYVTKIHKLVRQYQEKGYGIIVVGDKNHPEIIGINGWANNSCIILKDVGEATHLQLDQTVPYLLVSQTTYKKEVVENIVSRLKEQAIELTYIPTICSATKERQEEASFIAKQVDTMIVIGSAFSSNTQKLYEICKKECANTHCILDESYLEEGMFKESQKIGITAGASTPSDIIESVIKEVGRLSSMN